ncbi:hypothetical protein BGP_2903 [Beggiatoa sp. PS]|nr:hypothetical protein BGP_2903 [Beggiatoa sp. PS]
MVASKDLSPENSELFISESKAQGLDKPLKDGRSIVGKRYNQALTKTKPEMAKSMMARAIRAGLDDVQYMIADAWFGTKSMLRSAERGIIANSVTQDENRQPKIPRKPL